MGEVLAEAGVQLPLLHIGIPDRFVEHGSREECLVMAGLDAASIRQRISVCGMAGLLAPLLRKATCATAPDRSTCWHLTLSASELPM